MDLSKEKPSKRIEYEHNPNEPMMQWLMSQPSSKEPLTKAEQELMTEAQLSVTDLYFMRAMKANHDNHIVNQNNYRPRQDAADFINEYGTGADYPLKKVKQ